MALAQSCENHLERIERISRAADRVPRCTPEPVTGLYTASNGHNAFVFVLFLFLFCIAVVVVGLFFYICTFALFNSVQLSMSVMEKRYRNIIIITINKIRNVNKFQLDLNQWEYVLQWLNYSY